MNGEYAYILVDSTSQAMRIEKLLRREVLACRLVPVPRHLSSDCGVCVRVRKEDLGSVQTLLHQTPNLYRSIEEA